MPADQFGKQATSAVAFQHKELCREDYGYECGLNVEEIALTDFALRRERPVEVRKASDLVPQDEKQPLALE